MHESHSEPEPGEGGWTLHIVGPGFDARFLVPQGRTTIGRAETAGLSLAGDPQVSSIHAELECTPRSCAIADRDSRNGTLHNGRKLPVGAFVLLAEGDELRLGQTRLQLQRIRAAEAVTAGIAPVPATAPPPPAVPPPPPAQPPRPHDGEAPPGLGLESLRLLAYLPETYHDRPGSFLSRFLALFESILLPVEWEIDSFDFFLDPKTAPPVFLAWLARWYGLTFHASWREAQQRQVMVEAPALFALRGTKAMLHRLLEIYTGHPPQIDDGNDLPAHTFHVRVTAPPECTAAQVRRLIDAHKPAHTVYRLDWLPDGEASADGAA